jgi:cephalosporin-C deacetylase
LEQTAHEPLDAVTEPLTEPLPYETFLVTYRSFGGIKVRARLAKPIDRSPSARPLPAIITAPGYGGREQGITLSECQRGYIILQIFPRGQGESAEFWQHGDNDKLASHLDKPQGHYYQGGYMDVVRGVNYLLARPDVNEYRIGAMGTSQGGGLVLAAGALEPRIRTIVAHVPFLCDLRACANRRSSYVYALLREAGPVTPGKLQTLEFFDPVNLAHRLDVPVLLSAGGLDKTCPAASIEAVYHRLSGIKSLAYFPDLIHTSSPDFYEMGWQWMERYLRRA